MAAAAGMSQAADGEDQAQQCQGQSSVGYRSWMRAPLTETGPAARTATLTGWGRTEPTVASVRAPTDQGELAAALKEAPARGVIARGWAAATTMRPRTTAARWC